MKTKEEKKQFCLEQIAPYYNNPELCGYNKKNQNCMYKTKEGKQCVFGKNLKEYNEDFEYTNADELLRKYGEDILIESSRGILSSDEWISLQRIHDNLAIHGKESIILQGKIEEANLFTLEELKEFASNLEN